MFTAVLYQFKPYMSFFLKPQEAASDKKDIAPSSFPPSPPPPYEKIDGLQPWNGMLNTKLVKQSTELLQLATEMPPTMAAMDVYLVGLEKGVAAMPLSTDPETKAALGDKLAQIMERYKLADTHGPGSSTSAAATNNSKKYSSLKQQPSLQPATGFAENLAVRAAVALKQSPIPGYLRWLMMLMVRWIIDFEDAYRVRRRAWRGLVASAGWVMDFDHDYQVHQTLFTMVYAGFLTVCKASVAYLETPSYDDQRRKSKEQ